MACEPTLFDEVPLFATLDADEKAVLAENVELRKFKAKQRIYKIGDVGGSAYILINGEVNVTTVDEDKVEVIIDKPMRGDIFGLASMLENSPHQTTAIAMDDCTCLEIDRHDITVLLEKRPAAGLDMLAMVGKHFHTAQNLIRSRAARNANEMIEDKETLGERIADKVAKFGGSWKFIITFGTILLVWISINTFILRQPYDPYPFILLNLFLSMLAAIQAPVILMSQNRQDTKDRVRSELDYHVNLKAELEVSSLIDKISRIEDRLEDLTGALEQRSQLK